MEINHLSNSVRYTGRWAKREDAAITTATGGTIELAFTGKCCVLKFDMHLNSEPFPHIYIQLDNGAKTETRIEHFIRVEAPESGNHVLKIIFKCSMEDQQRWYEPLVAKVAFIGAEADGEGILPEDTRKIIEFIGDSITEGTWVDEHRMPYGDRRNHRNMAFQNDSTGTYAYLTAEALNMKPCIMGYGSVGITKSGGGGVPKVADAYPYYFHNHPIEPSGAEIIVINHGANDYMASAEEYINGYKELLDIVRNINPTAKIIVVAAYVERFNSELGEMIENYNTEKNDHIYFINTKGWIPKEHIHPTRDGHRIVANNLTNKLREILGI